MVADPSLSVPKGVTSAAQLDAVDRMRFLAGLPQVSRPLVAKWFRQSPYIMEKADLSPVTIADQEIESTLRDVIRAAFPDDAIQGEEFGSEQSVDAHRFCWVIDPIDGTKAFISGKPVFGTLVGLTDKGVPLAGLVDMPCLDETYVGHVAGKSQSMCQLNATIVQSSHCQSLAAARIATTSPLALTAEGLLAFDYLSTQAAVTNYGGDCHNYALLASGHVDLVLEDSLGSHDMIAVVALMLAAGAFVTDTAGQSIQLGRSTSILAAATEELHAEVMNALAQLATG